MKSGVQTRKQKAEAKPSSEEAQLNVKATTDSKTIEKTTTAQTILSYAKGPTVEISTLEALLFGGAAAGADYLMTGSPTSAIEKAVLGIGAAVCTKGVFNSFRGIRNMVTGESTAKPAPKPAKNAESTEKDVAAADANKVVDIKSAKKLAMANAEEASVSSEEQKSEEKSAAKPKAKKR